MLFAAITLNWRNRSSYYPVVTGSILTAFHHGYMADLIALFVARRSHDDVRHVTGLLLDKGIYERIWLNKRKKGLQEGLRGTRKWNW